MGPVRVRVLRAYPRGKSVHLPGTEIEVPDYALPGILEARPPFGELVAPPSAGREAADEVVEEERPE